MALMGRRGRGSPRCTCARGAPRPAHAFGGWL